MFGLLCYVLFGFVLLFVMVMCCAMMWIGACLLRFMWFASVCCVALLVVFSGVLGLIACLWLR